MSIFEEGHFSGNVLPLSLGEDNFPGAETACLSRLKLTHILANRAAFETAFQNQAVSRSGLFLKLNYSSIFCLQLPYWHYLFSHKLHYDSYQPILPTEGKRVRTCANGTGGRADKRALGLKGAVCASKGAGRGQKKVCCSHTSE